MTERIDLPSAEVFASVTISERDDLLDAGSLDAARLDAAPLDSTSDAVAFDVSAPRERGDRDDREPTTKPLPVIPVTPAPVSKTPTTNPQNDTLDEHAGPESTRQPRHRADRVRNRRSGAALRRASALGAAGAIVGVTAFGAVAASATGFTPQPSTRADVAKSPSARDEIVSVADVQKPTITTALSVGQAPFTGGTQVTVKGRDLDQVASVTVGGTPAPIVSVDASQVTFAVPAVAPEALGSAEVVFADSNGEAADIDAPGTVVAAAATAASAVPLLDAPITPGTQDAADRGATEALVLQMTTDPRIDAQVNYVLTYWSSYNPAFPTIWGYDCANFASQSLLARGWAMDAGWYLDGATGAMSPSWASSTALRDYLLSRADAATRLDDSQRSLVKAGDIAQFDWDGSGDRDHTAVVTRVEHSTAGTKLWVGGHTKDADFWDVDVALASGGGSVHYFSIR